MSNAHSALLELGQTVVVGQALPIKHPATGKETSCRVIGVNPGSAAPEVGVGSDEALCAFLGCVLSACRLESSQPRSQALRIRASRDGKEIVFAPVPTVPQNTQAPALPRVLEGRCGKIHIMSDRGEI